TLPSLRREAFRCATSLRWRQQRRQAASAVALPPALNSSHTIAQHLRCLTDPGDPLFLKKTKQPQAIGSGLVTCRFLRGLQLRNIFLDQQRISSVHTQPPVPSTSLILNRANTLALILIPILPIFSLCRTSRFIRIGMRRNSHCRRPQHSRSISGAILLHYVHDCSPTRRQCRVNSTAGRRQKPSPPRRDTLYASASCWAYGLLW